MALPELTDTGELPLGVHPASLQETLARFGTGHAQRIAVGERLERIYQVAVSTGQLARFVVYGSFVTNKDTGRRNAAGTTRHHRNRQGI